MGRFQIDGAGRVQTKKQVGGLKDVVGRGSIGRVRATAPAWIEVRRLAAAIRQAARE
jgi:hypothetical protein